MEVEEWELDEWDVVEGAQSRQLLEAERTLHRKRCEEELKQAEKACEVLITAQGDVRSGKLKCQENCIDEVHRLFCIPDTSVKIQQLVWQSPPVVRTAVKHSFKTGQNVILTGLKLREGAPVTVRNFVESISRDHAVVYVDDCRFSLGSMTTFLCDEEEAKQYLDLSDAEVGLNVSCWALGRTSIAHSALLAMAQTALGLGVGRAAAKFYTGLCVSCNGLQTVADASARHLSHRQRIMPPGKFSDSLHMAHGWLRRLSDFEAPDVKVALTQLWGRAVESVQPKTWRSALGADVCAECLEAFSSKPEESSKHHCRHCGRVVCDACSQDRKCVPWEGYSQPVRVCKPCVDVVEVKNLTLQQYDALNEQIRVMAMGLCRPKGQGKGPPLPAKGKGGKGKGKDKAQSPGLGALGHDIQPQISEVKDFVLLSRQRLDAGRVTRGPSGSTQQRREVLMLRVASHGCKGHLLEIEHTLRNVTLEGAQNLEHWFDKVEQIMPLEERLSADTLERLKAVPMEEMAKLPEYERYLCQVFLPLPFLYLRWQTLRLARDLEPQERLLGPMALAERSLGSALRPVAASSADVHEQLWPEVKNMVAVLYELIEPKCESLQELASRTQVSAGRELFAKAWAAGAKHDVCNVKGFLERMAPTLEEPSNMQAMLENLLLKRKEWRHIEQGCDQEGELQDCSVVESQLNRLGGLLSQLEETYLSCLEVGSSLLLALGESVAPVAHLDHPQAGSLARRIDQSLESLRSLALGLRLAEPSPPKPRRRRTAKDRDVEGQARHLRWHRSKADLDTLELCAENSSSETHEE